MKYVSLITALLMMVQVVLVIIVARKELPEKDEQGGKIDNKDEEKEQSVQLKKYKRFDKATSMFTMLVMVAAYIYYIWNPHSLKPHFEGRAAATVSLIMLLYLVYVNTNGYRDIKYLLSLFSDRNKKIGIYELVLSSEIFGLLVMTVNNHFLNMKLSKRNSFSGEVIEITSRVIAITTLLVMSASVIITIAYFIKEKGLAKKWKKIHKKIARLIFGNIPSRRSFRKSKTWENGFWKQLVYFVVDSIYKFPMFVLVLVNKALAAICDLIYGITIMIGKICGIAITDRADIGRSRAMLNILWGSIIVALSVTYLSIVLSNSYKPSLEKAYSFITGIILIPTILTVTNK